MLDAEASHRHVLRTRTATTIKRKIATAPLFTGGKRCKIFYETGADSPHPHKHRVYRLPVRLRGFIDLRCNGYPHLRYVHCELYVGVVINSVWFGHLPAPLIFEGKHWAKVQALLYQVPTMLLAASLCIHLSIQISTAFLHLYRGRRVVPAYPAA